MLITPLDCSTIGTICSKHDKIMEISSHLSNELEKYLGGDLLDEVQDFLSKIETIADQAKEDGVRMEDKLSERKKEVEDLENDKKSLEDHASNLEDKINELEK
jgi:DNA repair exonuclease SbcCD ATPase subunit